MTGLGLHPHDYMIVYILIQSPISHLWFQTKFPRSHYSNVTWCHVTNYRQIDCFGFNRLATTTASLFHITVHSWWRDQMETFSALLARCPGNSPVTREFPAQRPVTRSFDVLFVLRPIYQLFIKENIRDLRYWSFMRGIHQWPVDSSHKWPVKWEAFSCDDVSSKSQYASKVYGSSQLPYLQCTRFGDTIALHSTIDFWKGPATYRRSDLCPYLTYNAGKHLTDVNKFDFCHDMSSWVLIS